ncbi:undecaprenyl-diphosphate phosphatase [Candidatus Dependentiae bacterium]|nr:undecaprenyl-diphosphate phosphatase [Candidatus Dependentiae bacterium]
MLLWMIIQILAESLPISSSGHVLLVQRWYEKLGYIVPSEQIEQINFLLHGPALIIMIWYFFTTWSEIIVGKQIALQDLFKITTYKKIFWPCSFILIVDIITFIFWKFKIFQIQNIDRYFLTFGFVMTAIMIYFTQFTQGRKKIDFVWWQAIVFAVAQSIAFLPGISRFAITFLTARCLGYAAYNSFAFSFLIQFPLVVAACIKSSLLIYHNDINIDQVFNFWVLLGMVPLTYLSYKIFSWVGRMIVQNKIWYFSFYMILPIIISILV